MILAKATYGIALTRTFGGSLPMEAFLAERVTALQQTVYQPKELKPSVGHLHHKHVEFVPTADEPWLVAGFEVSEDELSNALDVAGFRERWEGLMDELAPDVREALMAVGEPRVSLIYGQC